MCAYVCAYVCVCMYMWVYVSVGRGLYCAMGHRLFKGVVKTINCNMLLTFDHFILLVEIMKETEKQIMGMYYADFITSSSLSSTLPLLLGMMPFLGSNGTSPSTGSVLYPILRST